MRSFLTLAKTTMKNICCLLLAGMLVSGCRTPLDPANSHSNLRTRTVLKYIQSLETKPDKRLLSGQFSNFGDTANLNLLANVHYQTGHWPAILGVDYAGGGGINTETPNRAAIEYWEAGGLVTISTHLYNPARATNDAFSGLRDRDVDLNTLLAPGTEAHARWMQELDQVATGLQELQNRGVVVLWRPFHEMNGNWFWWDGKDPETFKQLWRQMFVYFTRTKHLNNLLWVFNANEVRENVGPYADYYPGADVVDVLATDVYRGGFARHDYDGLLALAGPKPIALGEVGKLPTPELLHGQPRWAWFMLWGDPSGLWAERDKIRASYEDEQVVTREKLPWVGGKKPKIHYPVLK